MKTDTDVELEKGKQGEPEGEARGMPGGVACGRAKPNLTKSHLHFSATPRTASPAGAAALSGPRCQYDTPVQCGRGCGGHDKRHVR